MKLIVTLPFGLFEYHLRQLPKQYSIICFELAYFTTPRTQAEPACAKMGAKTAAVWDSIVVS